MGITVQSGEPTPELVGGLITGELPMGWGLARSTSGKVTVIVLVGVGSVAVVGVGLVVVVGVGAVVVGVRCAAPDIPALGTGVVGVGVAQVRG